MEQDNIGRTPDDIPVRVFGAQIPSRTIVDVKVSGIQGNYLLA